MHQAQHDHHPRRAPERELHRAAWENLLVTDLMTDRYGTHRPVQRVTLIAVSAIVGLVALTWLGWAAWFQATPDVASSLASYDVIDAHSVDATIELRIRSATVTGSCLLRAYAADHTVVGEMTFAVPQGRGKDVTVKKSVRTERKATSLELIGCTTPHQNRPR
jgi:hypothetical protein